MKFYLITTVFIFFMSGCSTMHPAITEYRINSKLKIEKFESPQCIDKSLKVAQAFSSGALMSLDMDYAMGNDKQFTYTQSKWALSPNHAISAEIVNILRDMNSFKTVQISKSRTRNDMILETSIDEFIQNYTEDKNNSSANVKISLTLIDAKSSKVVATKSFHKTIDAKTLDSDGGVKALNLALKDVLKQSAQWIGEVCK